MERQRTLSQLPGVSECFFFFLYCGGGGGGVFLGSGGLVFRLLHNCDGLYLEGQSFFFPSSLPLFLSRQHNSYTKF